MKTHLITSVFNPFNFSDLKRQPKSESERHPKTRKVEADPKHESNGSTKAVGPQQNLPSQKDDSDDDCHVIFPTQG